MMQPNIQQNSYTLLLIEAALTLLAIALAFAFPHMPWPGLRKIKCAFTQLARRKTLACLTVGASMLLLRVALLPLFPVPHPFLPDDFSFLLAADTFVHGRLANPTPALWPHFETIHVTLQPTYTSMYFPAAGVVMAAGKILFGQPWAGILIASSLMCAALCWALQAWLPPQWALLGGFIAVLRIGLFSYWTNTFTGAGSISALGGALVLGAFPRFTRTGRLRYAMIMAVGIAILSISRPYEGVLICIPVALALAHWALFGKNRPPAMLLVRRAAVPLALIAATLAWLGYYDYRAFGNPKTLPYTVDRATYAVMPYYVWQHLHPAPQYRHANLERFYTVREMSDFNLLHSPSGILTFYQKKLATAIFFFAGFLLLPPLLMAARVIRDRRVRFLVYCVPFWAVGMGVGIYLIPHYLAPFTVVFFALGLQCVRHLRVWKPGGAPAGRTLVRLTVCICLVLAGLRVCAQPLHMSPEKWPASMWMDSWIGPGNFGSERAAVTRQLEQLPGNHLALVRYTSNHEPMDEWIYNGADIDGSRIIWAQDMDAANNAELMRHYKDRDVWLVQPDVQQGRLAPYPMSANELAAGQ
jgi:hypothetical protein